MHQSLPRSLSPRSLSLSRPSSSPSTSCNRTISLSSGLAYCLILIQWMLSVAPARVNILPSPPMERKSPLSTSSSPRGENRNLGSPSEEVSRMSEDRHRKERPSPILSSSSSPKRGQDEQKPSVDDYEKGLVLCGTCGEGVPFRDPQSGGFTLRLWDMHRDQCRLQHSPRPEPIVFTPETTMDSMANPPLKKRRAKRTEEERIEYLRTDPFVAQFEPYRVLCGSCNKWIRLRPNSTYCSIPWDAHRKSCLSKKAVLPVDHRSAEVNANINASGRPRHATMNSTVGGARGGSPNGHIVVSGVSHGAHQPLHRIHASVASPTLSTKSRAPAPSLGPLPPPAPFAHGGAGSPYATPTSMASGSYASGPDCSPPMGLHDISPGALASHDARRKNAEQRAAALKADPLLREVEPNRVFCGLCGKWVQLRQDSSFCAYPWHQHRGKCLARYQRRQEKAHAYAQAAQHGGYDHARYNPYSAQASSHLGGDLDGDGSFDDEPESDDDHRPLPHRHAAEVDSDEEEPHRYSHAYAQRQRYEKHPPHPYSRAPPPPPHVYSSIHGSTGGKYKLSAANASIPNSHRYGAPSYALRRPPSGDIDDMSMDEDADVDGDDDVDMDDDTSRPGRRDRYHYPHRPAHEYSHSRARHHSRRRAEPAPKLADLDSASGRMAFISASVVHLFGTTYGDEDELSVGALVNYLNAAIVADKHDEFDLQEVTRAVASLAKTGVLVQEGDRLRPH